MTRIRSRAATGLVVIAAVEILGGCGGDEEKKQAGDTVERVYRAPTTGQTTPEDVPPPATTPTETTPDEPPPASTSPEDEPGGGGDEEPARTEVTLVGARTGVKPLRAGVAPYIAVRITLTSKDGSKHTLRIAGRTLAVGGTRKSAFVELSGLPPGRSYKGVADGVRKVRITSASEPGP